MSKPYLNYFSYEWGGLMQELSTMDDFETLLKNRQDLRLHKTKLKALEESKTIHEIRETLDTFSDLDRNYLNSPMLDILLDTYKTEKWFILACSKGNINCVRFLLDKKIHTYSAKNEEVLERALNEVCAIGDLEIAKLLLDNGASVHDSKYPGSILTTASMTGHLEIVKLLLTRGANVQQYKDKALNWAGDNIEMVKFLLESGANIHYPKDADFFMDTFVKACASGLTNIVKLYLDKGANVHINDDDALIFACRNGYLDIVKLLLDKGANVHAQYNKPLLCAKNQKHEDIITLLLNRGTNPDPIENFNSNHYTQLDNCVIQ